MKKIAFGVSLFVLTLSLKAQRLHSPNGNFELLFSIKEGMPFYNLKYKGNVVLEDSKLGLRLFDDTYVHFASENATILSNSSNLDRGFTKSSEQRDSKKEFWQPVLGEKKTYANYYNELSVTLNQTSSDRNLIIRFRLFDDGLGFRYEFPYQKKNEHFRIKEEDTEFDFPADMKAWWIVADYDS